MQRMLFPLGRTMRLFRAPQQMKYGQRILPVQNSGVERLKFSDVLVGTAGRRRIVHKLVPKPPQVLQGVKVVLPPGYLALPNIRRALHFHYVRAYAVPA